MYNYWKNIGTVLNEVALSVFGNFNLDNLVGN